MILDFLFLILLSPASLAALGGKVGPPKQPGLTFPEVVLNTVLIVGFFLLLFILNIKISFH